MAIYDVFISYSSENVDKVVPLAEGLRDRGLRVWFDRWSLDTGDAIARGIDEATNR